MTPPRPRAQTSMEAVSVEASAAPVSIVLPQTQLAALDATEELLKGAVVKNIEAPSHANLVEIGKALEANAFLEILYSRDRISQEAISAHEAAHDSSSSPSSRPPSRTPPRQTRSSPYSMTTTRGRPPPPPPRPYLQVEEENNKVN